MQALAPPAETPSEDLKKISRIAKQEAEWARKNYVKALKANISALGFGSSFVDWGNVQKIVDRYAKRIEVDANYGQAVRWGSIAWPVWDQEYFRKTGKIKVNEDAKIILYAKTYQKAYGRNYAAISFAIRDTIKHELLHLAEGGRRINDAYDAVTHGGIEALSNFHLPGETGKVTTTFDLTLFAYFMTDANVPDETRKEAIKMILNGNLQSASENEMENVKRLNAVSQSFAEPLWGQLRQNGIDLKAIYGAPDWAGRKRSKMHEILDGKRSEKFRALIIKAAYSKSYGEGVGKIKRDFDLPS